LQFSVAKLLGSTAFVAIGLAALASASHLLASAFLSMTILALCAAVMGAIVTSGAARAFWLAFLLFAGVHLLLTLGPWLDDVTGEILLSRLAIDALGRAMGQDVADHQRMPGVWLNLPYATAGSSYGFLNFVVIGQCWFSLALGCVAGELAGFFAGRASGERRR